MSADGAARAVQTLCSIATGAAGLAEYRNSALCFLRAAVGFDAALFHELSPRVPLTQAAVVGLSVDALARHSDGWDETAVHLQPLLELALEQGGAATDREAFGVDGKRRRLFEARVAKPLGMSSLLIGHLHREGRVLAAVVLLRKRRAFARRERLYLAELLPALALGDWYWQNRGSGPFSGLLARPQCRDQRLTPRQRQVVECVALGHTNQEIGLALGLSRHTVRNTLADACQRLGASNRAEVVRLAVLSLG